MTLTTTLFLFVPLIAVAALIALIQLSRWIARRNLAPIEKAFGHPLGESISISSETPGVTARFDPAGTRRGIPSLTFRVQSVEEASFDYSLSERFSWYDKCFKSFCEDEKAQAALKELFSLGFKNVNLLSGELYASWMHFDPRKKSFADFAEQSAKNLNIINEAVFKYFQGENLDQGKLTAKKGGVLAVISFIPTLVLVFVAGLLIFSNYVLDPWKLLVISCPPTPPIIWIWVHHIRTLSKRSKALKEMATTYTIAFSVGAFALVFSVGCALNIWLPQSMSTTKVLPIKRFEEHWSKSGRYYTARIENWVHPGAELDFRLPRNGFAMEFVRVTISRGALGLYWVSDYEFVQSK